MYKVKHIADGSIVWKGDAVIGIKGATLPETFYECDCIKIPGNAFDYALAPGNEYTEEQLAFIDKAKAEWGDDEGIDSEPEYGIERSEDAPPTDSFSQSITDDGLPF